MSRYCQGPCRQGRLECPTPYSCMVAENDDRFSSKAIDLMIGAGLALSIIGVVLLLASVVALA